MTAMSAEELSGLELSMGYDGELGIGSIWIAVNARAHTMFFCSCQPSPPSMAQLAATYITLAVMRNDVLSPIARRQACVGLVAIPLPCCSSKPSCSASWSSEQPARGPGKRDCLHVQCSSTAFTQPYYEPLRCRCRAMSRKQKRSEVFFSVL